MPLTLSNAVTYTIAKHEIKNIEIDLVENQVTVAIADQDANGVTLGMRNFMQFPIKDHFGTIIVPGDWDQDYPTGPQMYELIQYFVFNRLQEQPGENGLGEGVVIT